SLLLPPPPLPSDISPPSLHDALPISSGPRQSSASPSPILRPRCGGHRGCCCGLAERLAGRTPTVRRLERGIDRPRPGTSSEVLRSEEHTSELQSPDHLVCRLLLEKKK